MCIYVHTNLFMYIDLRLIMPCHSIHFARYTHVQGSMFCICMKVTLTWLSE